MKKIFIIIGIAFINIHTAYAASVFVVSPSEVTNHTNFNVMVKLDTGGSEINSVDIILKYPRDLFTFKGYREDNVIKKIWIIQPKDTDGVIHFSGIIPGGVEGIYDPDKPDIQPIPLVSLLFTPKINGTGDFTINHSEILKNDGYGTPLSHEEKSSSTLVSIDNDSQVTDTEDKELPEPFIIEYIPSGFFSKTPPMISFFTTDKGSGIEKYQMKNSRNIWLDVVSPVPVTRGIVKSQISIRAVDFSGNIRQSSVEIPGLFSPLQLFSILMFFGACYFVFFMVKRKR